MRLNPVSSFHGGSTSRPDCSFPLSATRRHSPCRCGHLHCATSGHACLCGARRRLMSRVQPGCHGQPHVEFPKGYNACRPFSPRALHHCPLFSRPQPHAAGAFRTSASATPSIVAGDQKRMASSRTRGLFGCYWRQDVGLRRVGHRGYAKTQRVLRLARHGRERRGHRAAIPGTAAAPARLRGAALPIIPDGPGYNRQRTG